MKIDSDLLFCFYLLINNRQMKNRQFIILCVLIIVGFSILYYQNLWMYKDMEWNFLWSVTLVQDKIDTTSVWILNAIYWLD